MVRQARQKVVALELNRALLKAIVTVQEAWVSKNVYLKRNKMTLTPPTTCPANAGNVQVQSLVNKILEVINGFKVFRQRKD